MFKQVIERANECGGILNGMFKEISLISGEEKKRGLKRSLSILALWLLVIFISFFLSNKAHADIVSHGILDDIANQYQIATHTWDSVLVGDAHQLFFLLASIEVAWAGIIWVMEKDNLTSFTTALIKKIMWLGFFFALLMNFGTWVPAIINSFANAGMTASHIPNGLSPSLVVEVGLQCLDHIMSAVSKLGFWSGMFPSLMAALCSLFILGCFFVIALQLLVTLVESYIILSAGIIFLGFGGSRLTSDFVQKFLGYAISVGVKLFMIYLIIGIGSTFSDGWAKLLGGEDKDLIRNFVVVSGATFFYAGLVWMIPKFAANLMSGVSTASAGSMLGTAATATGGAIAAAGVGAAAIGGASTAVNSATQMASGASASSGGGAASMSSSGGGLGGATSSSGASSGGGSGAFNMPAPSGSSGANNSANGSSGEQGNSNTATASSGSEKKGEEKSHSSSSASSEGASSQVNQTSSTGNPSSSADTNSSNASGSSSGQNTNQANEGEVSSSSSSGSSSTGRASVSPPSQEDGGGFIEQASSEKSFSKMFTPQQIQAHTAGNKQTQRRNSQKSLRDHLPNDEAPGATVHIKLDHPHD